MISGPPDTDPDQYTTTPLGPDQVRNPDGSFTTGVDASAIANGKQKTASTSPSAGTLDAAGLPPNYGEAILAVMQAGCPEAAHALIDKFSPQ